MVGQELVRQTLDHPSPLDQKFSEQFARPGYAFLTIIEKYLGQEISDDEHDVTSRLSGEDY